MLRKQNLQKNESSKVKKKYWIVINRDRGAMKTKRNRRFSAHRIRKYCKIEKANLTNRKTKKKNRKKKNIRSTYVNALSSSEIDIKRDKNIGSFSCQFYVCYLWKYRRTLCVHKNRLVYPNNHDGRKERKKQKQKKNDNDWKRKCRVNTIATKQVNFFTFHFSCSFVGCFSVGPFVPQEKQEVNTTFEWPTHQPNM